ncbi:MAG: hypothetical protein NWS50_01505, partial [Paracoccaceae bacterium]|nr:hypothetical protein [Paracoccaceae bacterium]
RRLCLTRHLPQTDRRGQCVKGHRDRSAPRQRPLGQMRKVAGGESHPIATMNEHELTAHLTFGVKNINTPPKIRGKLPHP